MNASDLVTLKILSAAAISNRADGGEPRWSRRCWPELPMALFCAADQVIARISTNVSVHPVEPNDKPLRTYLHDLQDLWTMVPAMCFDYWPRQTVSRSATTHRRTDEHHTLRCFTGLADAFFAQPSITSASPVWHCSTASYERALVRAVRRSPALYELADGPRLTGEGGRRRRRVSFQGQVTPARPAGAKWQRTGAVATVGFRHCNPRGSCRLRDELSWSRTENWKASRISNHAEQQG